MSKLFRRSARLPAKKTKHQQEMMILRVHHEKVMRDSVFREATLVGSGVFVRNTDGKLVVAKPYDKVIVAKRTV